MSLSHFLLLVIFFNLSLLCVQCNPDYRDALAKSIIFFQGQRSGHLPPQDISWRGSSGLSDGSLAGVDLTGGYYDAGDNVKFNLPMAYTTTLLSWSVIENSRKLGPQLPATREAIRWATDYLLKCARATPERLYVGVGDPNADHKCWERPEDMDTARTAYYVTPTSPGSDVAGETAAALAAASIVFKKVDESYSKLLLSTAKDVLQFAMQHRGSYSDFLGSNVCPFYCSYSGYTDELLWGAGWVYKATNETYYVDLLKSVGGGEGIDIFSWDNKYAGAHVLLAKKSLVNNDETFGEYRQKAEDFMCKILPDSPSSTTKYTAGGLMYKMGASNLQYVTSITFLLTTYSKYMAKANYHTFTCGKLVVTPETLRNLARRQVDYILGDNPMKMSYMVGYGTNYPKRIHHRGSSLPSVAVHSEEIGCEGGFQPYYYGSNPNPNTLIGAVVGGPDQNDFFPDERGDYTHSEPTTYTNAALVGPLASFAGKS
ncbi:endoglucanase 9-like [Salvia splendens]|uniref:endoglucanase 9-like n=1 Tax=Salvia splendens TaxID=180675 RepID=UPI001104227A|nr:endoglucanase 9-like [Salvia splendens]